MSDVLLLQVIRDVLGPATSVTSADNFYALGGDSLSALRILARLESEHNLSTSLGQFMAAENLAAIGRLLTPVSPSGVPSTCNEGFSPSISQRERLARDNWCAANGRPVFPQRLMRAIRVRGPLDYERLTAAVRFLGDRHDALRCRFSGHGNAIRVTIADTPIVPVFAALPKTLADDEAALARQLVDAAERPFDLAHDSMLRVLVYRCAPQDHVVLVVTEHLVTDRWSFGLLLTELSRCYANGPTGTVWPPAPSYAEWTLAELARRGTARFGRSLQFWKTALMGDLPVPQVALPSPRGRPANPLPKGARCDCELEVDLGRTLRQFALSERITIYSLTHAALVAFLAVIGGRTRIDVVTPSLNRADPALERTVGRFANRLLLRTEVGAQESFADLARRVAKADTVALDHAYVPWATVVEAFAPELFGVPLDQPYVFYDVIYNSQDAPFELAGTECSRVPLAVASATPGIAVFLDVRGERWRASLHYEADVYTHPEASQMLDVFVRILRHAATKPATTVPGFAAHALREAPAWISDPGSPGLNTE